MFNNGDVLDGRVIHVVEDVGKFFSGEFGVCLPDAVGNISEQVGDDDEPVIRVEAAVMAAYNIFGFQSCALKVTCTVTCFITWSVT